MIIFLNFKWLKKVFIISVLASFLLFSCKPDVKTEEEKVIPKSAVQVANISIGPLKEYIELNASSSFLKKSIIKSTANGYIEDVTINIGSEVSAGDLLYTLKTKEASAIHNTGDSTLRFSGIIKIRSAMSGVVVTLDKHPGDYVQDGDQLCTVADKNSWVFLLDVPFELRNIIKTGSNCEIVLPNLLSNTFPVPEKDKNLIVNGKVMYSLPSADATSQTISYVVKPDHYLDLPENILARVRIIKNTKENAVTLPREAVLTNETQSEYWVMKVINDSTAVKLPVQKGIETKESVEILSPKFTPQDKIITVGNYGLADTAKIFIIKPGKE